MDFKDTLHLPQTSFPMKGSLALREPEFLAQWESMGLYQKLREQSQGKPLFVLHFGPPYANGHIHTGHALCHILKDIVVKFQQMAGKNAPLVPGWDCHGLPIEWKIEEAYRAKGLSKNDVPISDFRAECRAFAHHWMHCQKGELKRLGILADWNNPYSTMNYDTEAKIVEQLGYFLMEGSLYRGLKPVLWSTVEQTALAEAEVDYKDHTSTAIDVAFPIVFSPLSFLQNKSYVVIWTTTPWTLPANRAIAFHEEILYVAAQEETTQKIFLVSENLFSSFCERVGENLTLRVLHTFRGSELSGTLCAHPFRGKGYDFEVPLLPGSHVTEEMGTGFVHTAPSHGVEDFELAQKFGIEIPEIVAGDGRYHAFVPLVGGQGIFKVTPLILDLLSAEEALLSSRSLIHSYPHSWRSKAPLIYRATSQWFISMDQTGLRTKALEGIESVTWIPQQGKNRIRSMVLDRPDWCISRQRTWGTPLTLFVHKQTGQVLRDSKIHQRIVSIIEKEGADAWFLSEGSRFLSPDYCADDFEKVTDVLDVWFDSGCTQAFVLKERSDQQWPADLYLEGSDQHRGWFQSSLLAACGVEGSSPYRAVLTHGFVLDDKGYKMSKSVGNVVAPEDLLKIYGADILRLWVVSADFSQDMRIGKEMMKQQEDIYRRLRNTLRYLLGGLDPLDKAYSSSSALPYETLPTLEKWILHRLFQLNQAREEALNSYDFVNFYADLHGFCTTDLSAFYFDIRKDCLYCDGKESPKRQATQFVMHHVFECLVHWLAPVLSFTAEEAWQERHYASVLPWVDSIHLQQVPSLPIQWNALDLEKEINEMREVRRVVLSALEEKRNAKILGSSLQASVEIYTTNQSLALRSVDWAEITLTSQAVFIEAPPPSSAFMVENLPHIGVMVEKAAGHKCDRCWKVLPCVQPVSFSDSDFSDTPSLLSSSPSSRNLCHRCQGEVVLQ